MLSLLAVIFTMAGLSMAQVPYLGPDLPPGQEPGIPDYSGCPVQSCNIFCPPGAIQEGEYCPSLVDETNGGCFADPPEFTPIECDQVVCGTVFSRFFVRDTDWYQLVLTSTDTVRVCVAGQFPALVALIQPGATAPCENYTVLEWAQVTDCPCERICIDPIELPAGTYWIVVTTSIFNCAESCVDYRLEVNCGPQEQLPNLWDMGDLQECYPTEVMNPAHRITEIAWLGAAVDAEPAPQILNQDEFDDGVAFLNQPWTPCTQQSVQVQVTGGVNYAAFVDSGGVLYLNAWKDGDLNCSFCDVLCDGNAPEWIVQNVVVTPGPHTLNFMDPGVLNMGVYEGRFRFRLSEFPLTGCPPQATADVGEVEDYIISDLQLAVELLGGLLATPGDGRVTLAWTTASETNNDHFDLLRDGVPCATRPGAGTSSARHEYQVTDEGLANGTTYTYTLVSVDANGTRETVATAEAVPSLNAGPVAEYALDQNYPNPFNPSTSIRFALPEPGFVTLKVFTLTGREVATLVSAELAAGRHVAAFDARTLPSGMYLYRIEANGFTANRKMLLMK